VPEGLDLICSIINLHWRLCWYGPTIAATSTVQVHNRHCWRCVLHGSWLLLLQPECCRQQLQQQEEIRDEYSGRWHT
jgi:hypothetical protein